MISTPGAVEMGALLGAALPLYVYFQSSSRRRGEGAVQATAAAAVGICGSAWGSGSTACWPTRDLGTGSHGPCSLSSVWVGAL